jgi:hypothetical protein
VDPKGVRAFLDRDHEAAEALKREYWADRFRADWRSTWDASQSLLAHARSVRPEYPSDEDREADLAAHISLRARLDRAAHALPRR